MNTSFFDQRKKELQLQKQQQKEKLQCPVFLFRKRVRESKPVVSVAIENNCFRGGIEYYDLRLKNPVKVECIFK